MLHLQRRARLFPFVWLKATFEEIVKFGNADMREKRENQSI